MIKMIRCFLFFLASAITFTSLAQTRKETDTYYQTSDVEPLMAQYDADKGSLTRFYTITNSPERRERFRKFNEDYLAKLASLDFDKMGSSSQVDYILFKRRIDNEIRL